MGALALWACMFKEPLASLAPALKGVPPHRTMLPHPHVSVESREVSKQRSWKSKALGMYSELPSDSMIPEASDLKFTFVEFLLMAPPSCQVWPTDVGGDVAFSCERGPAIGRFDHLFKAPSSFKPQAYHIALFFTSQLRRGTK